MHRPVDPVRYAAAAARFRAFFEELRLSFVEREDVLRQVALALLCREHVLLMGPPGTAKSQIASAVFGRIIDETTGQPSLYARQITESTIQTDLVGPLDFKTLMETGRTEHFTDEGMLGAVHAFLDEVFDGRDMLLRSALNVLHERELKQGTRVTRGRVECALMTSNRYISDILEGSRETLLAFIDRIAFIGFVPRGFARREHLGLVLRRHAGGAARPSLDARLTVQDLDVLQDAVEATWLSEPACDALAALLEALDAELHAAARADATFIPTRYLSTRTAVRAGRVLRAACVHDRIFKDPERPLEVRRGDFAALRLHLVLTGPSPEDVERLLAREVDTHERRQLGILRTEREIFDRCLGRLPSIPESPRPPASPPDAPPHSRHAPTPPAPPRPPERDPREPRLLRAIEAGDAKGVAELLRELVPVARSDQPAAERAARLVDRAVASLQGQAIEAALAQGDRERPRAAELHRLVRLAAAIEDGGGAAQSIARWLRGRALAKIDEMATFSPGASASDLEAAAGLRGARGEGGVGVKDGKGGKGKAGEAAPPGLARDRAERRLADLEEMHELRRRLLAQGTDAAERDASRAAWERAVGAAEDDLVALLDAALRETVSGVLGRGEPAALRGLLGAIQPEIERLEAMARRLAALRQAGREDERAGAAEGPPLKARVLGPRLGSVVAAALSRMEITDREALLAEIEALLTTLGGAGLAGIIAPRDWLTWATAALLRADRAMAGDPLSDGRVTLDYDGYRRLRAAEQRVPNAYTLAEIALRVAPAVAAAASPAEGERALAALAAEIPPELRERAVDLDLGRIERAVVFLERWWAALTGPLPSTDVVQTAADGSSAGERAASEAALREILLSRIFNILWDESALSRFAAEASLIAEVFPAHAGAAEGLRGRLEALDATTRRGALDLLRRRADAAWADTLRGAR